MQATLLGHQSWLISYDNTNILIDPVLYDSFGSDDDNSIEIYPPRFIDFSHIPKIDAIILSHEHSDHFHMPTLLLFKESPIITSTIMVDCVTNVIEESGLRVKSMPFYMPLRIGELEIILYPADIDTVFWESRVSQILVRKADNIQDSLFIAVDALVSKRFINDVDNKLIPLPKAIAVSNNSQFTPKGVLGSLDNFKDEVSLNRNKIPGIAIIQELVVSYLEGIDEIKNVIICGGGFTKKYDTYFGAFPLSDQNKLAEIANYFSIDKKIFGPLPGQRIDFSREELEYMSPISWVKSNSSRMSEIKIAGENFKKRSIKIDIKPVFTKEVKISSEFFTAELNKFARLFMLSNAGSMAIDAISANIDMTSPYGLMLKLRCNNASDILCYALNLNISAFELISPELEMNIPFGVELYLNDFNAILLGKIQIWDLGGIGVKSWYLGNTSSSPVGFLYSCFGEQIRPDLNNLCLKLRWKLNEQKINN
jgi:hypothetical protein